MSKSKWIWNPDAFERYHGMLVHNRRTVSGTYCPPMWRVDSPSGNLFLYKVAVLEKPETVTMYANTECATIIVDGKRYHAGEKVTVPEGRQMIKVNAFKESGFPAIYVEGDTFASDETWLHGSYGGKDVRAGTNDMYTDISDNPEIFKFSYKRIFPVNVEEINGGKLYDFGKESFGKLVFENMTSDSDDFTVYCGESKEEALDEDFAVVRVHISAKKEKYVSESVAFRYVFIPMCNAKFDFSADFEYLPIEDKGNFVCDDEEINKIYSTSSYTLHLNAREGFFDGIKRDRWVWGGDAYQSFLADYYLMLDRDIVKRTLNILHGAEPMTMHVNTIPDYTFYWVMSLWEYYLYTGDKALVSSFYDKLLSTMNFAESKLCDGLYTRCRGDWVFVDWADFDKDSGPMCAEQMLLCAAYKCASYCAELVEDNEKADFYKKRYSEVREKINTLYWDDEKSAFIDDYATGNRNVTRHANIFAILYDLTNEERKGLIKENVIKNPEIAAITTPYFRFFELAAMAEIGEFSYVEDVLRSYWGGMLKLGATTFWEEYDPRENGREHYAMYGKPYDRSLCHAWGGSSPVYLAGRYILGVKPTSPNYETYTVTPCLKTNFGNIKGKVPTLRGDIYVEIGKDNVSVYSDISGGSLNIKGQTYNIEKGKKITISL